MYLIADAEEVFLANRGPYIEALKNVERAAEIRAKEIFGREFTFGEIVVKEGEYAKATLRPEMFYGIPDEHKNKTKLKGSFRQYINSTGWIMDFLSCDLSDAGRVGSKFVMGIAGIAILDPVIRITQIRIRRGDRTFPVIDIEEAKVKGGPIAIIFKIPAKEAESFVFDPTANFALDVYAESTGYQSVKPIGVAYLPQNRAIVETYPER